MGAIQQMKSCTGLRDDVADQTTPRQKLECLVNGIFNGIAADETGQTLTPIQALAMATKTDHYSPELLNWTETQVLKMAQGALTDGNPQTLASSALVLMLCFDGVALRQETCIEMLTHMRRLHRLS